MNEEWNVNGSYCAIEGITSPDGRVLGFPYVISFMLDTL